MGRTTHQSGGVTPTGDVARIQGLTIEEVIEATRERRVWDPKGPDGLEPLETLSDLSLSLEPDAKLSANDPVIRATVATYNFDSASALMRATLADRRLRELYFSDTSALQQVALCAVHALGARQ